MTAASHTPRTSIRRRFTLWMSALLIISVGISFTIIYRSTSSRLRTQIHQDVSADTDQLAESLHLITDPSPPRVLTAARRYVAAQPFASISTLLFVLPPGAAPVSNYPELFEADAPDDHESAAEQSRENRLDAAMRKPHLGSSTRALADVGTVELVERPVALDGQTIVVGAAQPVASVIRAQRGVIHSFLLAGGFIALAVLLGTYLVGTRITAPLRRMALVASTIDAGDLRPRMDSAGTDEVGVLATAFNHMVQRLEDAFRAQREFTADASHELRTPLTVINGQLEVLAHRSEPTSEEIGGVEAIVNQEIRRMRRIIDDLLLLAQAEQPNFLIIERIDLQRFLTQVLDDATLVADRRFELGPVAAGHLDADPDRLAQALRNLINNAINHTTPTTGTIVLKATADDDHGVQLAILDDGPGIPPEELDRIFQRFHRAANGKTGLGGTGLGLAIVRAITDAHGGTVSADNNGVGSGARFAVWLPGFRPEHDWTPG
jgi:two-component system OmpR family sensor kinase